MQTAKNYGWSKGKKLRLEERKLSVGMQPEITPLGLVESPVVEQPLVGWIPGTAHVPHRGFPPVNNQVCAVQHLVSLA